MNPVTQALAQREIASSWVAAPPESAAELWHHLKVQWPEAAADTKAPLPSSGEKQVEPCIPAALRDFNALRRAGTPARIVTGRLPDGRLHAFVTLGDGTPIGAGAWGAQDGFRPNTAFDGEHLWLAP